MTNPGAHYAERFKELLQTYPHPEGHQWRGIDLEHATKGFVNGSYVTALKKGRIHRPGLDKLQAIADTMDFPFEMWLEGPKDRRHRIAELESQTVPQHFAERLNYLFETIKKEPEGTTLEDREVADLSHGRLSVAEVGWMRSGEIEDPTRTQLLALCDVFDVDFSYWDDHRGAQPLMDPQIIEALKDEESYAILHKSFSLPEADKNLIMVLMEELQSRSSYTTKNTDTDSQSS